nr:hypothetical protein [Tanacetum cinerariifolium]
MLFHIIVKDKKVLIGDLKSKESTLQVVYDVLKLTPFYKAFLVTADVREIYMQEFWATATVYHHSIHFKMNNKKRIVNLEYFKEMLQISLRIPNQQYDELPFEEEILAFLRELGHGGEIKMINDVNINKLHQPWRSFAIVINKCLSGKSTGYDNLCLSQAQIVCGMYHKKNMDFAYLLWEDFVYQVEYKDAKKSNEMYYPWDDHMFTTIKLVSRHQNTQQYSSILPVELTNKSIRNLESYKEYYAIALGAEPPKKKASNKKKQSSSDTTVPPPTPKGKRLKTSAKVDKPTKGKQPTKTSTAKGLTVLYEKSSDDDDEVKISEHDYDVNDQSKDDDQDDGDEQDEQSDDDDQEDQDDTDQEDQDDDDQDDQGDDDDEQSDSDNDGDDFVHPKFLTHDEETKDEESFDPIVRTPSHNDDDEDNDDSDGMNVEGDEVANEEEDADELYRDVNIHLEGRDIQMEDVQTTQVIKDTHVTLTLVNPEGIDSIFDSTLWVDVQVTTAVEPPLLSATTLPPPTISVNPHIRKEQVKEQVKVQVSKILPKIKKTINEQLEAEVLTRSSNSSKTSYIVAADLSELELKKIIIEKIESNKSIHRSDEQNNLYKALVDAYECDRIILDTYGDTITLKIHRDDEDKDEEPSDGSNRGSKRRREGKEPESTSATDDQPVEEASWHPHWFQKQAKPPTPDRAWNKTLPATHGRIQPWISNLAKKADSRTSFNELIDTPIDFSAFVMNRLKVDTLTPELLVGPTYKLMKGSCKSLVELEFFLEDGRCVIPFDHFINNDLEYLRGGASSQKYTTLVTKTKAADYGHIKWIEDLVPRKCRVKYRLAMTNMLSGESCIGGANINSSMDLRSIGNLLEFSTPNVESSLSQSFKSSNGIMLALIIKRYIDTKPIHELIHYCLKNPPYKYTWADKTVPVSKEAVQIILTGIDNDIYSIFDACPTACEMWKSIERLKQDESINVQDLETNLYWEFRKFTSRDGESLESYYSRFYKIMNELFMNQCDSQELKTVSYHKLYAILKQHQNEVNELRAERLAQPSTIAEDDEMSKDKEIDKLMVLISLSFKKIYKPTNNNLQTSSNTSRANQDNSPRISRGNGYDNQRLGNVAGARETVGTMMVQNFGIRCYNCKEFGHVARECQKPKKVNDATYHKEEMLLCKQEEAGIQLNAKQADWRDDTDDQSEDQELEAHYMYMAHFQEVNPDAAADYGPIFDTKPFQ